MELALKAQKHHSSRISIMLRVKVCVRKLEPKINAHDNDPHYFLLCACILVSGADTEPELPPDVVEEIKKQLEEGKQRALQQNFYYADEQGSG